MNQYYNHDVFLLFLGGLFSLILTVAIVYIKQASKRGFERKRLEAEKRIKPEAIGDIEANLDDSVDFQLPNICEETAKWCIQPLFIVSFASLFSQSSEIILIAFFLLIILTFLHELYLSDRYANKLTYQLCLAAVWLLFFFYDKLSC